MASFASSGRSDRAEGLTGSFRHPHRFPGQVERSGTALGLDPSVRDPAHQSCRAAA
jgi:hypothetical protein